jgi:hypothetical protein
MSDKSPETIKYANLRKNLIVTIRSLADRDYQQKVWIDLCKPAEKFEDDLSMTINFLYDFINDKEPQRSIGLTLRNKREVDVIKILFDALENFLNDIDHNAPDEIALKSKYWPNVLNAATEVYKELTNGDEPAGTFEDMKRGWEPKI